MKFGYYYAKADRLDGNCVRLAVGAEVVWKRSVCANFGANASPRDHARITERPDGSLCKSIVVQDFFVEGGQLWTYIVENQKRVDDVDLDTSDFECDES